MRRGNWKRILLKVSGQSLAKLGGEGIDPVAANYIAKQIARIKEQNKQVAIVIGGGNILRGAEIADPLGIDRPTADYMGMLATLINALALQSALEGIGVDTRVQSAISTTQVAEPYIRRRCIRHLEKGRLVILAGGSGAPYFTTDTASVLRANEIGADVLLKATKVDGVYNSDPAEDSNAVMYENLSYEEVISKGLRVMDATAITLAREALLPIVVFNMRKAGNIGDAAQGFDKIGTLISGIPSRG